MTTSAKEKCAANKHIKNTRLPIAQEALTMEACTELMETQ